MIKALYLSSLIYPQFKKTQGKLIQAHPINSPPVKPKVTNSYCRNTVILPSLINKTFNIYNGTMYLKVLVSENIIGHKFGEFSQTKKRYYFKKGKKLKQ